MRRFQAIVIWLAVSLNAASAVYQLRAARKLLASSQQYDQASECYIVAAKSAIAAADLWLLSVEETQDDLVCSVDEPDPI